MTQRSISIATAVPLLCLLFLSFNQKIEGAFGEGGCLGPEEDKLLTFEAQELYNKLMALPKTIGLDQVSIESLNEAFGNIYDPETRETAPFIRLAYLVEEYSSVKKIHNYTELPPEFASEVEIFKLTIARTVRNLVRHKSDLKKFDAGAIAADIFGRRGLIVPFHCLIMAGVGSSFSQEFNLYHSLIYLLEKSKEDPLTYPINYHNSFAQAFSLMLFQRVSGLGHQDYMGRSGLDLALAFNPGNIEIDVIAKLEDSGFELNAIDRYGNNFFHRVGKSSLCTSHGNLLRYVYLKNQTSILAKNKAGLYPFEINPALVPFYLSTLDLGFDLRCVKMSAAVRECLFHTLGPDGNLQVMLTSIEALGGQGCGLFRDSIDKNVEGLSLEDREDNRSLLLVGFMILDSLTKEGGKEYEDAAAKWSKLIIRVMEDYSSRWRLPGTLSLAPIHPHKEYLALVVGSQILDHFDEFDTVFNIRDPLARFPQLVKQRLSQRVSDIYARLLRPKDGPGFALVTNGILQQFQALASEISRPEFPVFAEVSLVHILKSISQSVTLKLLVNLNHSPLLKLRGSSYLRDLAIMPHPLRGSVDLNSPTLVVLHDWAEDLESTIKFFTEEDFEKSHTQYLSREVEWKLRQAVSNLRHVLSDVDKELIEQAAKNTQEPGVCQFLVNLASLPSGLSSPIEECLRSKTFLNPNEVNLYESLRQGF